MLPRLGRGSYSFATIIIKMRSSGLVIKVEIEREGESGEKKQAD